MIEEQQALERLNIGLRVLICAANGPGPGGGRIPAQAVMEAQRMCYGAIGFLLPGPLTHALVNGGALTPNERLLQARLIPPDYWPRGEGLDA